MPESTTTSTTRQSSEVPQRLNCYWPPRPFTLVVMACVLAIAFVANFPAIEVPHAGLREGRYGLHFDLVRDYEHGWPARYARRDYSELPSADLPPSPWQPWEGVRELSIASLFIDLGLWGLVVIAAGVAAQWWRLQRRAIWQLGLRDLLALTGAAGLVFAWIAYQRVEYLREQSLADSLRQRPTNVVLTIALGAPVPAYLPESLDVHYRSLFNRPCYYFSNGDTDLACQHRHVVALRETAFHSEFPNHLRQMPGLEALDLSYTRLPYFDATRQATILRGLSPLPNLRGISLYSANVTDADMEWLAACPRLEVIDLSDTKVGDHGLAQLARLPRLRVLRISSPRVSDAGCRSIAQIATLEELSLASRNVRTAAGVNELSKLANLKLLDLSVSSSEAALDELRRRLPECKVVSRRY